MYIWSVILNNLGSPSPTSFFLRVFSKPPTRPELRITKSVQHPRSVNLSRVKVGIFRVFGKHNVCICMYIYIYTFQTDYDIISSGCGILYIYNLTRFFYNLDIMWWWKMDPGWSRSFSPPCGGTRFMTTTRRSATWFQLEPNKDMARNLPWVQRGYCGGWWGWWGFSGTRLWFLLGK